MNFSFALFYSSPLIYRIYWCCDMIIIYLKFTHNKLWSDGKTCKTGAIIIRGNESVFSTPKSFPLMIFYSFFHQMKKSLGKFVFSGWKIHRKFLFDKFLNSLENFIKVDTLSQINSNSICKFHTQNFLQIDVIFFRLSSTRIFLLCLIKAKLSVKENFCEVRKCLSWAQATWKK